MTTPDRSRSREVIALLCLCAAGALLIMLVAGCAGPSRARYAELLHECREQNREHVRLLREYDERTAALSQPHTEIRDTRHTPGEKWTERVGCNTCDCQAITSSDAICSCMAMGCLSAPAQQFGRVEMGLGGF